VTVEPGGQSLVVRVPGTVKIQFNGKDTLAGKPVALADLKPGDRVTVQHVAEENDRIATELAAQREVAMQGVVREVDAAGSRLTIGQGEDANATLTTLPVAPECEVRINDRRDLDQKAVGFADLKPGDRVTVTHDTRILRVDAYRIVGQAGTVQSVSDKTIDVVLEGQGRATSYLVEPNCKITISGETASLGDLRSGDLVDITHDTPGATTPRALTISARRPILANRWAVFIGIGDYDDRSLGKLPFAVADAALLQETLTKRSAVPPKQALLLADVSLVRMREGLATFIAGVAPNDSLLVYFVGHALRDSEGRVFLAPKEFNQAQMAATGLPLQWLVDQMEASKAKDKLLVLDASHAGPIDEKKEPSSAEMFGSLQAPPGQAALRTVTGLASCSEHERGRDLDDKKHGLFAWSLAQGFSGSADKNRDNRIEPTELSAFLAETMPAAGQPTQTAKLVLPDARPARLTEEARRAIRALASKIRQSDVRPAELNAALLTAQRAAGKEIEPQLLHGLYLLKGRQRTAAQKVLDQIRAEKPDNLLALQASAWLRLDRRTFAPAVADLTELANKLPKPRPDAPLTEETLGQIGWIGQLRAYAELLDERRTVSAETFDKLDAAVGARGDEARKRFELGREKTKAILQAFDAQLAPSGDEAAQAKVRFDRRQLTGYVPFPVDAATQKIVEGLDK
jgi:uncharacterized caspase-like protein